MHRTAGRRRCGICGQVGEIHTRARDGRPDVCVNCAPRRPGRCGVCGGVARIAVKATADSPAAGICCYRLPTAVCVDCGRERPCFHASGPEPLCERCWAVRRARVCLDCGQRRVADRRVEGGVVCGTCDIKRGGRTAACHGCRTVAPLVAGLCDRCRLGERVGELAAGADAAAAAALAPFFAELAASPNPASTLRWFYTPGFDVTRRLLAGEVAVSHQGLDQAAIDAPQPVAFVRAKLVNCRVLEPRDETSASFARWHAKAALQVTAGTDRAHVRAFATWHVGHQLACAVQRRGDATYASLKYARSLVTEAIKLTVWLHAHRLELADLRQDVVDEWIADGRLTRRRVRLFLGWLERAGVIGALEVAWHDGDCARVALGEEERFAILGRLLHDREIDLRDRFAGSVLLLYGTPLTRICALRTGAVLVGGEGERRLRLGRGGVPLPEPLGEIALALRERAAADGWLLPGRHAGKPISADSLSRRLKRYGIDRAREGRHAALLALAACVPAPILAERVGIHQARAAQWVRLAGASYGEYVGLRSRP